MSRPTSLYRFFDDQGRLLYIGVTSVPRWDGGHRRDKPWWGQVAEAKVEHFDDRATALSAERYAIRNEGPEHNVVHNRSGSSNDAAALPANPPQCKPLSEGDVVGVGIRGRKLAPVGMVTDVDEMGFRMSLVDWISGYFWGTDRWFPWRLVDEVVFAELMAEESRERKQNTYDLDPLSRFQTEWEKHIERLGAAE